MSMNQKVLPTLIFPAAWNTLLGAADEQDGDTLVGPGWTAERFPGAILLWGETREVNRMHAVLCS